MSVWRALNWIMAVLFLLAVLVQWNDPDPVRWMAIYGAAVAACLAAAVRGRVPIAAPLLVMVIALAWSVATMREVPAAADYTHMFDAWEMKSITVEEAREATGLLIVAAWMFVIAVAQRRGAGKRS